ncbi:MAG: ATP-dependent helicase [Firmicutes bacterium HGW-Firmicutes-3]|jgi:DNA excision repair protein ERCC-2|nr:MAG: ATP-dependent helicase [Firmicutes bacterium HGW-Firmicutes-3]
MAQYNIQVSVRNIIDYILRGGSIESVALSSTRAVDGTRAHQKFQKAQKDDYQVEVKLVHTCQVDQIDFTITGRMDGLFEEEGMVVIDEIKSTGIPLHLIKGNNIMHWAQVKMYGYIYAFQNHLMGVTCRLTYIDLEDYNVQHFTSYETIEDLEDFYYDILGRYAKWALSLERFKERCLDSIGTLTYPFATYRKGQKQLMHGVYKTIIEGQKLFARAPTGIGKTIATLYPAIKALGEKKTEKIFYLTAKTIGKEVANQTLNLLEDQGMVLKRVTITAKEKICLNEVTKCNKEDCPYALGHYDRVNTAIEAVFKATDCYTREVIESFAKLHQVCPYELSLDLALFCEVIVCDYNYVFDPSAKLQRFFVEGSGGYTLLIDEAHNLVDRGRSMYSVVLEKDQILDLRRKVKDLDTRLYKYMTRLNQKMLHYRKACENYEHLRFETKDMPYDIEDDLRAIIYRTEKIFKEHQNWQYMEMLLDFFFTAYDYVKKTELYSEKYITSFEKKGNNLRIHLYCMDPSDNIRMATNEMKGVVYFSATLLPMSYYMDLLGGNKENYGMMLSSPFDSEKLGLVIDRSISTKYQNRESSIGPIGEHIMTIAREKKGNYLVFFPSYKYMEDVLNDLVFSRKVEEEFDLLYQERGLTEAAKEAFIQSFEKPRERSLIAFSVLGGMFSEGIDLVGNRLIGVLIVGVGLPMICYENDLIKEHFGQKGFDYAYVYPGMNKVLQAAGRVIRTVHDMGVVVLLDERFAGHQYRALFPLEWSHYKTVVRKEDLYAVLDLFWNGENMNKS